ncbi:MAG: PilZ domain [Candidatus Binatota bacterium]|jgi:hypothetical protein|nr:PilZ domain [Candidatus Binatota bacterium]
MSEFKERRQGDRRPADNTGQISFGGEPVDCRVIDLSAEGAQVRIDGRRASRNLMGKRARLTMTGNAENDSFLLEGNIVWVRPAVNGVYLGLSRGRRLLRDPDESAADADQG